MKAKLHWRDYNASTPIKITWEIENWSVSGGEGVLDFDYNEKRYIIPLSSVILLEYEAYNTQEV